MECTIREDLKETELVPIWLGTDTQYICPTKPIKYRWIYNTFQVWWENKWYNAYSIDFDFID
jgi:hypothetical protein